MSGILAGSMILFALQFLTSLFFGRAFCGWVCPGAGLQQCCSTVTPKKIKNGRSRLIKYFIFIPWITTIVILLIRAGGIEKVDPLYMTNNSMPLLGMEGYIVYFLVVLLMVVMALTLGTRSFCRTLCWMAPFMVLGTKLKEKLGYRSLRLTANSNACTGCGQCTRICPMSLDVQQMAKSGNTQNSECILCGECSDICRFGAVKLSVAGKGH